MNWDTARFVGGLLGIFALAGVGLFLLLSWSAKEACAQYNQLNPTIETRVLGGKCWVNFDGLWAPSDSIKVFPAH